MKIALLVVAFAALALSGGAAAQEGNTTLNVRVNGQGRVTSSTGGISCPPTCTASYKPGTEVSLNAQPASGWAFSNWSGDCGGSGGCTVFMGTNRSVTATFVEAPTERYTLTVAVTGPGSVASSPAGIACPGDCSETYDAGTAVTLAPIAGANAVFNTWAGTCAGAGVCVVQMNGNRSAAATFAAQEDAPGETRPSDDTTTLRPPLGITYKLSLPFTCYPPNDLWLARLYQDVLKREIDAAALDALGDRLAGGASRTEVALIVLQSVEFRINLVQAYYQQFLKRPPNPTELAAGLGVLASAGDEALEALILGSGEYLSTRGGGTNDGFLDALFQDLLGRAPTATERAALNLQLARGTTRAEIALAVLKSHEARTRLIQGFYQSLLGRPPTQAEIDALLQAYDQGSSNEAIEAAILASDEYFGGALHYEAVVHWGDGTTSPANVGQNGERCTVNATHTYTKLGRVTVGADITSPDGAKTTLTRPAQVVPPPPPPPGKENVIPSGTVFIKVNGKFVPLTGFRQVPYGTELDTRKGKVALTSHDGSTGQFYQGIFKMLPAVQGNTKVTEIVLTGGNFNACKTSKKRTLQAALKPKSVRHVWGNAKGHFRTKGKYASATVRGTLWKTDDQCPGTLVTVSRGIVDVLDFVKHKHVLTRAGHAYLAKPKG